jgi:2-polyprenyl-3-methyl-5-hydroxy-6-metoxy-1,4-benzoquinol methylase
MICPICNSKNATILYQLYDDRYGYSGLFNLLKCSDCSHKHIENNFIPSELGNLYSNYYPRSNMKLEDYEPLKYTKGFSSWLNGVSGAAIYVPPKVKILDIGCGFGQSLGYHQSRGCEVFGVEADNNIQRVADKYDFNVKVGLFNPDDYEENFFDYVTMNQVLEHTTNPIEIFQGVSKVLKKNGKLIVTMPNANGWGVKLFGKKWINWHSPYHLQLFSKKSIYIAAQKTNFEIKTIKTITSSEWLLFQWIHIFTYPKESEESIFWKGGKSQKYFAKKVIIKLITLLHKIKVDHLITRFFDALGIGDNYVIILENKK